MKNETSGQAVARMLFMSFVYVADCDEQVNSADIERFTGLIANTGWASHPVLLEGLEYLREGYEKLWSEYESAKIPVQIEVLSPCLAELMSGMTDKDARKFKDALIDFIRRATPFGNAALSVFSLAGTSERRQARQAVEDAFERAASRSSGPAQSADAKTSPLLGGTAFSDAAAATAVAGTAPPLVKAGAGSAPEEAAVWTGGKIRVECVRINDETHDVKTFTFACRPARMFRYKPGQFATLELNIDGKQIKRSYTISSSPSRPHTLSITVKRVPGGLVSNWLHDHLKPGAQINLSGPFGKFNCFDIPAQKLLLISGGSGVTPMMSMSRWFADTAAPADIAFLNHVRTPVDVIFDQELRYLGTRLGEGFNLLVVPGKLAPPHPWIGPTGRFSGEFLQSCVPDFRERTVFICGPQPYMDFVAGILEGLNYPMQQFHRESFGEAPAAPAKPPAAASAAPTPTPTSTPTHLPAATVVASNPAPAPVVPPSTPAVAASVGDAAAQTGFSVTLEKSEKSLICMPDESLLEAAERAGVNMEYSCRTGRCGTCKVQVVSGKVSMDTQEALSEADIESGCILPCVARPLTPLTIGA